jgi:hypothetical protein
MNFMNAVSGFLFGPDVDRSSNNKAVNKSSQKTPAQELGEPSELILEQYYNSGALPLPKHLAPVNAESPDKKSAQKMNLWG